MFVLKIIWETIKWNHTKKNKCIIKDKYRKDLRKFFKYQSNRWPRENENYFSKNKVFSNEKIIIIIK